MSTSYTKDNNNNNNNIDGIVDENPYNNPAITFNDEEEDDRSPAGIKFDDQISVTALKDALKKNKKRKGWGFGKLITQRIKSVSSSITPVRQLSFSVNNYEDKLLPLMFHDRTKIVQRRDIELVVKNTLNIPLATVTSMTIRPGEPYFVFWFFISSYFPLISACLGPLANMISVIGLIQHWRVNKETGLEIRDDGPMTVLNAFSLAFGLIGNISLLMNFSGTIKYLVSQSVSVFCFVGASVVLLIDVLITNHSFVGQDAQYVRSEGFWFGVFTCFYYFCCALTLSINFIGYKLNKYPAAFNLDTKQRTLMIYTICFALWCVVGSCIMAHMIDDLTYGSALYYCTVSFLTIGLGDIVPKTPGAKVMALVLSLVGVLIMGLLIAMIRQVVLTSGGPTIFWDKIEKRRMKEVQDLRHQGIEITPEESFHRMRVIRRRAKSHQLNISLTITILIFMIFWLIGALAFHFTEEWSYFNSVYFCFLCLITIGYGDYAPRTTLGRVFFVSWSVSAVPLMTILISNVGDKLFDMANTLSYYLSKFIFRDDLEDEIKAKKKQQKELHDDIENFISDEEDKEVSDLSSDIPGNMEFMDDFGQMLDAHKEQHQNKDWKVVREKITNKMVNQKETYENILDILSHLKPLITDSIENPLKTYNHQEWGTILANLEKKTLVNEHDHDRASRASRGSVIPDGQFWLSEKSPLRLPLKEPNYLIMRVFFKIEKDLLDLIDTEQEDLNQLRQIVSSREGSRVSEDIIDKQQNDLAHLREKYTHHHQPNEDIKFRSPFTPK
ncbi:outward-rectifier potassium channel [Scheffersomyces coipomensis]|uniref:outward-rectifier potassium channel n=1 Tax=Scheffersomyces coipomensis TaxID=1788519 RepID=UPI00315DDC08